ncbi:hypothetical protein AB0O31_16570 [Kitasatospora cineracea]|uniref:hypothetical protein n=1 Tax=Kitasatospora cineracea TaxID=88074 RepID=UPI003425F619
MPVRPAAAFAAAAAVLALAGCTGADRTAAGAAPSATGSAGAASSERPGPACSAAPSPSESWLGGWRKPLPDEIRCLPHVASGYYMRQPSGSDEVAGEGNVVMVSVELDTAREQTLALCRRITELGYGTDGPNEVVFLSVGDGEKTGSYTSLPGHKPCFMRR